MFLHKTTCAVFLVCLSVFSSLAQNQALSKISIEDLQRHLTFIASDELQGRKLGTEVDGLGITADYLADHAKQIGLKPGVDNYFQTVPMVTRKPGTNNTIELFNTKQKSVYRSTSMIIMSGITGEFELKNEDVILAGFGEELKKSDVEGKVLIVAPGNKELFEKDEIGFNYRIEKSKIETLSALNPKAILMVTSPADNKNKAFNTYTRYYGRERYAIQSKTKQEGVPVLIVKLDVADELCGGKGKYSKYLKKSLKKDPAVKVAKGLKLNLLAEIEEQKIEAKNVIGIVEGSDPKLKDEYVVFMAHYDHLGMGKDGEVYNGADDNGSGTVAILEVAEAFASLEVKPKRSIVFLWVTCEEVGHIGSTYYCDNPIYPLEKTVASINLDMVGRVYESPRDDVWKDSPKKVKDFDGLYTLSNDVWPQLAEINAANCETLGLIPDTTLPKERFLRASDHYHFHKKGVPILNYATGYHADYHKVGDEVERINFEKIKRVADLCFLLGYEVANLDEIKF